MTQTPDEQCIQDIVTRIVAAGFGRGSITREDPRMMRGENAPSFYIIISSNNVTETSRSFNPIEYQRTVSYVVTVAVKAESYSERVPQLDLVGETLQDALSNVCLAGISFPALTNLKPGRYEASRTHPEQRLTLMGEFSFITGPNGRVIH